MRVFSSIASFLSATVLFSYIRRKYGVPCPYALVTSLYGVVFLLVPGFIPISSSSVLNSRRWGLKARKTY